jgi:hypothetical protein
MSEEKPVFKPVACKLSDPFIRFASMLDDDGRMLAIQRSEGATAEYMELLKVMRRFAWAHAGVLLHTYGDVDDKSTPLKDVLAGAEHMTKQI